MICIFSRAFLSIKGMQCSTMGKNIGYLCIQEILAFWQNWPYACMSTPSCKLEWNSPFKIPSIFGGKSHGPTDFSRKNNSKAESLFGLNPYQQTVLHLFFRNTCILNSSIRIWNGIIMELGEILEYFHIGPSFNVESGYLHLQLKSN